MATAKRVISVILALALIACPLLMSVGASASDSQATSATKFSIIDMIKQLFEKIKAKIKEILSKLGYDGPTEESQFKPRTWAQEVIGPDNYAALVEEYLKVINKAKTVSYNYDVHRYVYSTYQIQNIVGGDMTANIIKNMLDSRFPAYTTSSFDSTTDNMTLGLEPFGALANITSQNIKSGSRTINADGTFTITLVLYAELYSNESTIHSGLTSYCKSKDDLTSMLFRVNDGEFQGYVKDATFTIRFNNEDKLISQNYTIPAYYDVAGSYIIGKPTEGETPPASDETTAKPASGGGFVSIDTMTRIDYTYILK